MARAKKKAKPAGMSPAQEAAQLRRIVAKLEREKAELAAKAAKPVDAAATPAPPPSVFAGLPARPTDPLQVQQWIGLVIAASIEDTIRDEKLSPRERRRELRTNAAAFAKTVPDTRRWQAELAAKKHRERIEARSRTKGAPPIEPIP